MRPTLRQIKYFQAVLEGGSFSRAADRLGTTQANLSHAIRDLETALGTRLFDRTTRRVDLTETGRAFADGALAGLAEIRRAADAVRDLDQLRRGTVRIAAPPLLAAAILPLLLNATAEKYPDLELRIEDLTTDAIVAQVLAGRADLGIGTFTTDEPGLDSQNAVRDQLMAFFGDGHAFAARSEIGWADLADQRVIALTRESSIRMLVEIGFNGAGLALRPHIEVHQIHTALALVEGGAGVAVLPAYAAVARHGRAIPARPMTGPAVVREISIITARDRVPSAAARAVRPLLRRALREMLPGSDT